MALNKFMHSRNIYRTPPDFAKLSKLFADFSKISKMDVTGKVVIDFKDPHSLRVLTKCLLKSDFGLDVEIPEDRLVPTLPLRLNYILWIEDLMAAIERDSNICGIDIGTGACAVYPLLAAVKNKWQMIATEVDTVSLQKAEENIQRNNLQDLITLKNNIGSTLIECLFVEENHKNYDFCMCNPPFYSNMQELYESRSPARLPPKNGFTGSPQELITDGGELKFCRKLIDESKRCKDHVLIFTTMVGHKYNLSELLQDLKADGIRHTHTEFCQGRVTRWGLAWTYQTHDIYQLVPPREKQRKKNAPISHTLSPLANCDYNVETAYSKLKALFTELKIDERILNKCKNRISLDVIAKENTWSNQRRKRRLMKRMEASDPKKMKSNCDVSSNDECIDRILIQNNSISESDRGLIKNSDESAKGNCLNQIQSNSLEIDGCKASEKSSMENSSKLIKFKLYEGKDGDTLEKALEDNSSKLSKCNESDVNNSESGKIPGENTSKTSNCSIEALHSNTSNDNEKSNGNLAQATDSVLKPEPLIHAFMKLYKKEDTIQLEVEFLGGAGGKESVYQVVQYIKNNWK